ncbi:MAG TPA: Crp/Fnr family transcriptional regulator [Dehalococcoidia bacterium]|nr:Crp/Fnr family transcriptional regulator [Dehalococcoidia bacterium]
MRKLKTQNEYTARAEFLRHSNLFNDFDDNKIGQLALICMECSFKKGDMIYAEGDKPEYLYVFQSGKIKFFSYSVSGKAVVARVTSNADLGGIANLYTGDLRWLSAQALDDMQALKIRRKDFLQFMRENPELALKIQGIMEHFLHGLFNRFKAAVASPVEQRVFNVLYQLNEKFGTPLPFSDEDIASLVGTTRETTVRVLGRLQKLSIVKSSRCSISILDGARLRELKQEYPVM